MQSPSTNHTRDSDTSSTPENKRDSKPSVSSSASTSDGSGSNSNKIVPNYLRKVSNKGPLTTYILDNSTNDIVTTPYSPNIHTDHLTTRNISANSLFHKTSQPKGSLNGASPQITHQKFSGHDSPKLSPKHYPSSKLSGSKPVLKPYTSKYILSIFIELKMNFQQLLKKLLEL